MSLSLLPARCSCLDLLADGARFLLGVPGAGDGDLLAVVVLGAQRLAEPALVMRDQMRGGGEDVAGGAVIALEADDLGAGKIVLEAQDVVDLGAAPAIDRLVVVADAADVFGGGEGEGSFTSPLWGEVASSRSDGAGEGASNAVDAAAPSPGIALRADLSPQAGRGGDGACDNSRSHRYCATLVS